MRSVADVNLHRVSVCSPSLGEGNELPRSSVEKSHACERRDTILRWFHLRDRPGSNRVRCYTRPADPEYRLSSSEKKKHSGDIICPCRTMAAYCCSRGPTSVTVLLSILPTASQDPSIDGRTNRLHLQFHICRMLLLSQQMGSNRADRMHHRTAHWHCISHRSSPEIG